uniref:Ribonuclease H-like domain-containing protein n=1 Tax=Tanacetum cinerariifolium TaxID=118510 RepID=A0A6L2JX05_TANCI|nr:ribonuclease H-like domain-containing protein [Tanacetum cinerariifolium]
MLRVLGKVLVKKTSHGLSFNELCLAKLKETYDKLDGSIIFNLLHKIHGFKQGELTVSEYYLKLNSLWREFDIMTKLPKFSYATREDVLKHNQLMKLMQLLMSLNEVFQPIRSILLSKENLLDVKDAFAIVSKEESHRGIASSSFSSSGLGHPSDQAVDVLQSDLKFTKDSYISPCDICHKAKQTREQFLLSDHKTTVIGELVHIDL